MSVLAGQQNAVLWTFDKGPALFFLFLFNGDPNQSSIRGPVSRNGRKPHNNTKQLAIHSVLSCWSMTNIWKSHKHHRECHYFVPCCLYQLTAFASLVRLEKKCQIHDKPSLFWCSLIMVNQHGCTPRSSSLKLKSNQNWLFDRPTIQIRKPENENICTFSVFEPTQVFTSALL